MGVVDALIAFLHDARLVDVVGSFDEGELHAVDVGHPGRGVEEADDVVAMLKVDAELLGTDGAPTSRVAGGASGRTSVHADADVAVFTTHEEEFHFVLAFFIHIDVAPLQVVVGLLAEPAYFLSA